MAFKTIPFDGYLTITLIDCEHSVDFSLFGLEEGDDAGDGNHVQRLISEMEVQGKLVKYHPEAQELSIEESTSEALEAIRKAKENDPYLIELNERAKVNIKEPLVDVQLGYSQDFGSGLNFYCLRGGSYRPAKGENQILIEILSSKCSICGGEQDPFERFFASVADCWQSTIWEGRLWETLGSRLNIVDFPAKTGERKLINLRQLFLPTGSMVMDIRMGAAKAERSDEGTFIGCFCILPEGTKESLNSGSESIVTYCLPLTDDSDDMTGEHSLHILWLEPKETEESYPLFLSLQAFSEKKYEAAIILSYASFEKAINRHKGKAMEIIGGSEEWEAFWKTEKATGKQHWECVADTVLKSFGFRCVGSISPLLLINLKKLHSLRGKLAHNPKPINKNREEIFSMLTSAIFATRFFDALNSFSGNTETKDEVHHLLSLKELMISRMAKPALRCSDDANTSALNKLRKKSHATK